MLTPLPDSTTLRVLWSTIEALPSQERIELHETMLVRKILQETTRQLHVSAAVRKTLHTYLDTRISLIRTLAAEYPSP